LYGESDNADTALSMSMEMSLADAIKAIRAAQRDSLAYGYPTSLLDLLDLTEEIVVMALASPLFSLRCVLEEDAECVLGLLGSNVT